eukprot:Em0002g403a
MGKVWKFFLEDGKVVEGMDVVREMEAVGSEDGDTSKPVVIKDCEMAKTNSPATPIYSSPATPIYSSPATPIYSSPATPIYSSPATPIYSSPATPIYSSPATPIYSSPATPIYSSPATPIYSSPATPIYSSPATPIYSSPATPIYSHATPIYSHATPIYSLPPLNHTCSFFKVPSEHHKLAPIQGHRFPYSQLTQTVQWLIRKRKTNITWDKSLNHNNGASIKVK